jgi:hypothetical protein
VNRGATRVRGEPLAEWLERLARESVLTLEDAASVILSNLDGLTDDEGRHLLETLGWRAAEERKAWCSGRDPDVLHEYALLDSLLAEERPEA